jgi:hypothetical protein
MKKIVITIALLFFSLAYSNAQWRQFPCLITGDKDFAHSSSVSNNYTGSKQVLYRFTDNNKHEYTNQIITELTQQIPGEEMTMGNYCSGHISIKSNKASILKRRE